MWREYHKLRRRIRKIFSGQWQRPLWLFADFSSFFQRLRASFLYCMHTITGQILGLEALPQSLLLLLVLSWDSIHNLCVLSQPESFDATKRGKQVGFSNCQHQTADLFIFQLSSRIYLIYHWLTFKVGPGCRKERVFEFNSRGPGSSPSRVLCRVSLEDTELSQLVHPHSGVEWVLENC